MVDEVIAPMIHAQQIAWVQSDQKTRPPSIDDALRDLDAWLDADQYGGLTPEEYEYRKVMGL